MWWQRIWLKLKLKCFREFQSRCNQGPVTTATFQAQMLDWSLQTPIATIAFSPPLNSSRYTNDLVNSELQVLLAHAICTRTDKHVNIKHLWQTTKSCFHLLNEILSSKNNVLTQTQHYHLLLALFKHLPCTSPETNSNSLITLAIISFKQCVTLKISFWTEVFFFK